MKMDLENQSKMRISLRIFFKKGSQSAIIALWIAYGIKLVKRICEFVLEPLFEATCKRRAVSEVQNRVPATSRSGQIFSVCGHFFLQPLFESTRDDFKGVYLEKTSLKVGSSKGGGHRTAPISREARNWLNPRDWTLFRS